MLLLSAPSPHASCDVLSPGEGGRARAVRYGPFWIATTLVFLSAVAGNYASYVSYRRTHAQAPSGSDVPAWYYDIDKVWLSLPLSLPLNNSRDFARSVTHCH